MGNNIHIWDMEAQPPVDKSVVLLWQSYLGDSEGAVIALPRLVEDNAELLKRHYLSWIYELGQVEVDGHKVIDLLEIRPGLSFWWMTLIAEKCNFSSSPHIDDAIRLLAFDLWASENSIYSVKLTTENTQLAQCIRLWCQSKNTPFHWSRPATERGSFPQLAGMLPNTFSAMIKFIRRLWYSWPLKDVGVKNWVESKGQLAFFSYLLNQDVNPKKAGVFNEVYWGSLTSYLRENNIFANWLHIYCADASRRKASESAAKLISINNKNSHEVHVALESFLSVNVVLNSLRDWFKILKFAKSLQPKVSTIPCSGVNLWPLFKDEWTESFRGFAALNALLNLNLLDNALSTLPKHKLGIYLHEQQAWEYSLINQWKGLGHGRLLGAQHTTLLDWNLRNFNDPRCFDASTKNHLPMPDSIAINGPTAFSKMVDAEYPVENLLQVEALRYQYITKLKQDISDRGRMVGDAIRVLVVGDYLKGNTSRQIELLTSVTNLSTKRFEITVKPHPATVFDSRDFSNIDLVVSSVPLEELLGEFDLVFSSPITSAAVEAYCCGVPVVTMLDPQSLNLSPLRGYEDVFFVSTADEFTEVLESLDFAGRDRFEGHRFFNLDPDLNRWKTLLSESGL